MFVLGRNISSDWAISRSKFCEKLEKGLAGNQERIDEDEEQPSQDTQKEDNSNNAQITREKDNLKRQKRRKLHKTRKQKKRARIVIRNLPFQVFFYAL